MEIIDISEAAEVVSTVVGWFTSNLGATLIFLGFIIGISIVAALVETAVEGRKLRILADKWERK